MPQESPIEASEILPMFPTFVWKLQIKADYQAAMNAKMLQAIEQMRQSAPELTSDQGFQSQQTLHELIDFHYLVLSIQGATKGILRFLRIGSDAFEITACWANVLAKRGSHNIHSHPNNFLSGVYYLRVHPGADTINFHDPRIQTSIIRPPVIELTAENTDQVVVRVKTGTLLLFPAYLQHSVDDNESDHERISISFNIMFSSFTETMSKPLWQGG